MHAPVSISPEEPVGGRYDLAERVGEGNFAVTYRARDLVLGRTVAVKMLRAQYAAEPTFVARFEREARVAASVAHPNVVDVYDFGPYRDTFYIVMQFVPGRTLKEELAARGPLPAADAVRIAGQILNGLAAIHAAGIVHRDIKPQNVLLGPDRVARVTDFGVAHYPVQGALTTHGTTVGTASYMAPEQARGAALSEATDLYAVGVVLFELLSGRLPFEGENPMAVMLAHLQQAPPRLGEVAPEADVPPALEAEVMRALAKDPKERRPSADEMARALAASLVVPTPATDAERAETRTATMQVPFASAPTPAQALGTRAMPGATSSGRLNPRAAGDAQRLAGAVLPPVRDRRRPAAWLVPVVLFSLALAALGALVASGAGLPGFGGGEGESTSAAVALGDATETPLPSPTSDPSVDFGGPTARPPLQVVSLQTPSPTSAPQVGPAPSPTAVPSPTVPATATAMPTPTETPAPTSTPLATAPPEPTLTPIPTATPSPEPQPTATFEPQPTPTQTPAAVLVIPDSSGGVGEPASEIPPTTAPPPDPVAPDAIGAEPTPAPVEQDGGTLGFLNGSGVTTFEARQWRGGTDVNPDAYGREAVAIYGTESPSPRATLHFELGSQPTQRMELWLTGLGDETGTEFPFTIEINEFTFGQISPSFPNWTPGVDGEQGESASWQVMQISIPAGALRAGRNQIAVVSLQPGANINEPPYILLGEAALVPTDTEIDESAAISAESFRLSNVRAEERGNPKPEAAPKPNPKDNSGKNDKPNGNRGRGNGGDGGDGDDG